MSQLNYRQIETALARRVPFTGNSCHAVIVPGYRDDIVSYEVYSYRTLVAQYNTQATGEVGFWVSGERYSQTTSRLQNIIKRAWGIN